MCVVFMCRNCTNFKVKQKPTCQQVLSVGIEPTSPPSEGGILSIERREQYLFILFYGHKSTLCQHLSAKCAPKAHCC